MRILPSMALAALLCTSALAGAVDDKASSPPKKAVKLAWPSQSGSQAIRVVATVTAAEDRSRTAGPLRLMKPFGVAVDNQGRIFVADPGQKGVLIYDRQGRNAARWSGTAQFPLQGPIAVAFDRDGRLFVCDAYQSQILVFDSGGNPVAAFGKGVLSRPGGIAVDSERGRIYVSDVRLHQILSFDLRSFAPSKPIGGPTEKDKAGPGRFAAPANLAVNSKGQLLVSDMWSCRIQLFGPDGAFVQEFATECPHGAYGRPNGIAVDREDHVYVVDSDGGNLQIFEPDGRPLQYIAQLGPRTPETILRTGIAVDREDRIYISEQQNDQGRVQIFAQTRDKRRQSQPAGQGTK